MRTPGQIDAELQSLDFGDGLTKAQIKNRLGLSGREINALLARSELQVEGEGRKARYRRG